MTAKDKAIELVDKMYSISGQQRFSKAYASIAVDEVIQAINNDCMLYKQAKRGFWQEAKSEIDKL